MPPNLSLNPDASPAALARRPLGAGQLGSLGAMRMLRWMFPKPAYLAALFFVRCCAPEFWRLGIRFSQ